MRDDNAATPPGEAADRGAPREAAAWRLTFEYEDDTVRLVGRQRVAMLAPVDDGDLLARGQDGYWIEIRDDAGRPLYQQVLHQPVQTHYEVFSPEPGVRPTHVVNPETRGTFQAVVPDLPDGALVVVHGPPQPDEVRRGALAPARRTPRTLVSAPLRPKGGDAHGHR